MTAGGAPGRWRRTVAAPAPHPLTVLVATLVLAASAPVHAEVPADNPVVSGPGDDGTPDDAGGAVEGDPFAQGGAEEDRGDGAAPPGPSIDIRPEIVAYTQSMHIRDDLIYDPGNLAFNDRHDFVGVDVQWDGSLSQAVKFRGRGAVWAIDRSPEGSTTDRQELLEGYFYLHDDGLTDQARVGRVNYDWSTAVNWSPANILLPRRVEGTFNRDDLELQQGWDIVEYRRWQWGGQHTLLGADLDAAAYPESEWQAAYRWSGPVGPAQAGLILNRIEERDTGGAFTLELAPIDGLILWSEGSYQAQRDLPGIAGDGALDDFAEDGFGRFVAGGQYTLSSQWDLTFEYFHNDHGYDDREWDRLVDGLQRDRRTFEQTSDPRVLFDLLDRVDRVAGERSLRRNYLYLMLGNATGLQKYEYRQSIELNLDDDSATHYLEFIQNWRSNFSTRLSFLWLDGCDECEAGLRSTEYRTRLSMYLQF